MASNWDGLLRGGSHVAFNPIPTSLVLVEYCSTTVDYVRRSKNEGMGEVSLHWAFFWTECGRFGRCIFDLAILNVFDGTVQYVSFSGCTFRNVPSKPMCAFLYFSGPVQNFDRMLFD